MVCNVRSTQASISYNLDMNETVKFSASEKTLTISGNRLFSQRFNEHYASEGSPQQEKLEVFCCGNHLQQRFPECANFTVSELGFGAGLSFLVCSDLWLQSAEKNNQLHYIAFEKHPLSQHELEQALAAFPALAPLTKQLVQHYPANQNGFHRLSLYNDKVVLTLVFEDVVSGLKQLDLPSNTAVDAWFLDGFSPAKNPDMWQPELFKMMHCLSKTGTTLATYTAAGQVRRDLEAAGFTMKKRPGYGRKREQLTGELNGAPQKRLNPKPWLQQIPISSNSRRISIIGAGISGCALANRLASRGYQVTLLEKETSLAGAASSNPAALIHPVFTRDNDAIAQLSQQGYAYALHTLRGLSEAGFKTGFHAIGALYRPKDAADLERQTAIAHQQSPNPEYAQWLTATALSKISGVCIQTDGWYFPQGGWVETPILCQALIEQYPEQIQLKTSATINRIVENADSRNPMNWSLINSQGDIIHQAQSLVLTQGCGIADLDDCDLNSQCSIIPNRGQISLLNTTKHPLKTALCGQGYVIPFSTDQLIIGSTYKINSTRLQADDHDKNALHDQLKKTLPDLAQTLTGSCQSWTGIRTTSLDRMPLIGGVFNNTRFMESCRDMVRGKAPLKPPAPSARRDLYVMTGLGSRGIAYGLICAEALASQLNNEPGPLPTKIRNAMDSRRLLIREIKQSPA